MQSGIPEQQVPAFGPELPRFPVSAPPPSVPLPSPEIPRSADTVLFSASYAEFTASKLVWAKASGFRTGAAPFAQDNQPRPVVCGRLGKWMDSADARRALLHRERNLFAGLLTKKPDVEKEAAAAGASVPATQRNR